MDEIQIGAALLMLRERCKRTQDEISRGICSRQELSRYERAEIMPNKFLVDAFLQRMGVSGDECAYVLSEPEYEVQRLKFLLEESLKRGNLTVSYDWLQILEKRDEINHPLHQQFIYKIKAIFVLVKSSVCSQGGQIEDIQQVKEYVSDGLKITQAGEAFQCAECYHTEEFHLFLLQAFCMMKSNEGEQGYWLLQNLLNYAERHFVNEGERIKLYPKIVILMTDYLNENGRWHEVFVRCKKALDFLAAYGWVTGLEVIITFYKTAAVHIGESDIVEKMHELKTVFMELRERYASETISDKCVLIEAFLNSYRAELYRIKEVVKESREFVGFSQETLSSGICTAETLSRLERGKCTPTRKKYAKLMECMERPNELSNLYLDVEDFEILEEIWKIELLFAQRKEQEGCEALRQMEEKLDMSIPKNKQYFMVTYLFREMKKKTDTQEESNVLYQRCLESLIEALSYTISLPKTVLEEELVSKIGERGYLTRSESLIVLVMAFALHKMGKANTIELLFKRIQNLEQIEFEGCNYAKITAAFYINLSLYLEEMNQCEESIVVCKRGIGEAIKHEYIRCIDELLINQAYAMERCGENNKIKQCNIQKLYRQAYVMSSLLKHQTIADIIQTHYYTVFGEEV